MLLLAAQGPGLLLPGPAWPLKLGSSLVPQLITGTMPLSPAPGLRLPVSGGGRGCWEGEVNGCLFVYRHRMLYWFYTPAYFEIKEHFQGGMGASRLEHRERQYLFLGPWYLFLGPWSSAAWSPPAPVSSEVCPGAGDRMAIPWGQVGTQGARAAASFLGVSSALIAQSLRRALLKGVTRDLAKLPVLSGLL